MTSNSVSKGETELRYWRKDNHKVILKLLVNIRDFARMREGAPCDSINYVERTEYGRVSVETAATD